MNFVVEVRSMAGWSLGWFRPEFGHNLARLDKVGAEVAVEIDVLVRLGFRIGLKVCSSEVAWVKSRLEFCFFVIKVGLIMEFK